MYFQVILAPKKFIFCVTYFRGLQHVRKTGKLVERPKDLLALWMGLPVTRHLPGVCMCVPCVKRYRVQYLRRVGRAERRKRGLKC